MKLNTAPQNEAILANVGQVGEFRIRNSAKAFNILSSGLYANKIRAIIRELSCNAVDSHIAAGKTDVQFEVHMPTSLEPWFAIRDYGTGLTHDQVTNIYTTYFESTKTESNEFIGALGLGSKSPFSYTDNFTVTAIRDGRCGIYTAFINEHGVPSIALMTEYQTDEPSGVEVKFAVHDSGDFIKFHQEAGVVYQRFDPAPVITGAPVTIYPIKYETRDIIPGVHSISRGSSVAVMGNIAYPITVPNSHQNLGDLAQLLDCGLEMHFNIGELDFQASREGLSYIPQTIESIKAKLTQLNSALTDVLAVEANGITNLWERVEFLEKKYYHRLWRAACIKYVKDTALPASDVMPFSLTKRLDVLADELAKNYNIQIRGLYRNAGVFSRVNPSKRRSAIHGTASFSFEEYWEFRVSTKTHFVVNDLKVGATERIRFHYRYRDHDIRTIYSLEPVDRTKPMQAEAFLSSIYNPPEANIVKASTLTVKPRESSTTKNVSILKIERRGDSRGNRNNRDDMVWRDAGKLSSFDASQTYYYVPLTGFVMASDYGYTSAKELHDDVTSLPGLYRGEIYGIRKGDIDAVKNQPNWKNFEEHIAQTLQTADITKMMMSVVRHKLQDDILGCNRCLFSARLIIDDNSPMKKFIADFDGVVSSQASTQSVDRLIKTFAPNRINVTSEDLLAKYRGVVSALQQRYTLLKALYLHNLNPAEFAAYINLVDQSMKEGV